MSSSLLKKLETALANGTLYETGKELGIYFDISGLRTEVPERFIEGAERRLDKQGIPHEPCHFCGRPVSVRQASYTVCGVQGGGTLLLTEGDDAEALEQWHLHNADSGYIGCWVLGAKCQSKIPKQFRCKSDLYRIVHEQIKEKAEITQ